jgi:hypothetical protein
MDNPEMILTGLTEDEAKAILDVIEYMMIDQMLDEIMDIIAEEGVKYQRQPLDD